MVYTPILFREVDDAVDSRRRVIHASMMDRLNDYFDFTIDFILDNCEKPLLALYNETISLVVVQGLDKGIFGGSKKLSTKDIGKRGAIMVKKLINVMTALIDATNGEKLPAEFLRFLASISGNLCIPPQDYFTEFELYRLRFTYYATLKDVSPMMIKMICGLFILLRVLILKFLCQPWDIITGLE
mmetsp:Transcript_29161/g.26570  ORF Transcript_29161/g.26570 Transcript_29161/m.26570 type:complete len:185 (+) Transcript_29161:1588-2142(+)